VILSDDWATLHKTLDKLDSLANTKQNAAAHSPVAMNGPEQNYSLDADPYQQLPPPGSTGFYTAEDPMQSTDRCDPRHVSIQYSVVSEVDAEPRRGSYFPPTTPVSPYERAHPYHGYQEQQY